MIKPRFCEQCGAPLPDDSKFCTACGTPVPSSTSGSPVTPPPPPPSQKPATPPKPRKEPRKKPSLIPIIALILLAVFGSGAAMLFKSGFQLPEKAVGSEAPSRDLTQPETYLPESDKRYTYYSEYVDGTSQTFDQLVGKKPDSSATALVALIPESEAFTLYVVPREGGLFMVSDQDLATATYYLPKDLTQGKLWEDPGFRGQVLATGETCDVGFAKFEDCLLLSLDYYEADVQYTAWYAPSVGVVKMVYTGTEQTATLLKGIADVPPAEMQTQLDRYAPNLQLAK